MKTSQYHDYSFCHALDHGDVKSVALHLEAGFKVNDNILTNTFPLWAASLLKSDKMFHF